VSDARAGDVGAVSYDDWKAREPIYEEPPPLCEECEGTLDEFECCERCDYRFCPDCNSDPCQCGPGDPTEMRLSP